MFLHHCDCDHYMTVSDIRLEPTPLVDPEEEEEPRPATATAAADSTSNPNAKGLDERKGGETPAGGSREDDDAVNAEVDDTASGTDKAVGGSTGASDALVQARLGVGSGAGSTEASSARGGGRRRKKSVADEYPRLTYRVRPQVRRCEVCTVKVAVYTSFGHPLSDMVSYLLLSDGY